MHKRKNNSATYLIILLILSILIIVALLNKPDDNVTSNQALVLTLTEQEEPVVWKGLRISVGQQDGPGDHVSIPNHSEITSTEIGNNEEQAREQLIQIARSWTI